MFNTLGKREKETKHWMGMAARDWWLRKAGPPVVLVPALQQPPFITRSRDAIEHKLVEPHSADRLCLSTPLSCSLCTARKDKTLSAYYTCYLFSATLSFLLEEVGDA